MDQQNKKPGKNDYTIVIPPNSLKAKIGNGGVSKMSLEMANSLVEKYENIFISKANIVIQNLQKACNEIAENPTEPISKALRTIIENISHELKGEGATFGHPLISDIAKNLNVYLEIHKALPLNPIVLKAHIDALHVIIKHGIKSKDNAIANELCTSLENIVQKSLEQII
ncbi:MAG: hypothetical protein Q8S31_03740 [Alphaproteobacteria bacterium]|nr:hypothetical protein [Alphaproteobacteria bacterium]